LTYPLAFSPAQASLTPQVSVGEAPPQPCAPPYLFVSLGTLFGLTFLPVFLFLFFLSPGPHFSSSNRPVLPPESFFFNSPLLSEDCFGPLTFRVLRPVGVCTLPLWFNLVASRFPVLPTFVPHGIKKIVTPLESACSSGSPPAVLRVIS